MIPPHPSDFAPSITLNAAGGKRMLDHTLENVGKRLGIVYIERIPTVTMVDGKEVQGSRVEERVISASTIQGVFGNQFHTTGLSSEEAQKFGLIDQVVESRSVVEADKK